MNWVKASLDETCLLKVERKVVVVRQRVSDPNFLKVTTVPTTSQNTYIIRILIRRRNSRGNITSQRITYKVKLTEDVYIISNPIPIHTRCPYPSRPSRRKPYFDPSTPLVSCIAFGTAFSTLSGNASCSACGTLLSPVAWLTFPVSLFELVLWTESGSSSSSFFGAWRWTASGTEESVAWDTPWPCSFWDDILREEMLKRLLVVVGLRN